MLTKSVIYPALLALSVFATAPVFAADADPTIHQVYEAAEAGRFNDAQAMMDKVLRDHPNSAKAHYVEAELLGKQGRFGEAKAELNTAERLDPSQKFANPQAIQELEAHIAGPRAMPQQLSQPIYQRQVVRSNAGDGGMWTTVFIVVGLIALFFFIARALGRRNTTVVAGSGYPAYGPGVGPGMQPYGGPGMMGGQVGGGIGSGIVGGLATGAAMGAGIVAGEELMHHFTDRDRDNVVYEPPPSNNNWNAQDDMGGNDFGVSDSSSWDSGGGGGGGSDDW